MVMLLYFDAHKLGTLKLFLSVKAIDSDVFYFILLDCVIADTVLVFFG